MTDPDRFDSAGFADYLADAVWLLVLTVAGLAVAYYWV